MQLVKSLFCLVGRDNGFRFAAIQLLSYLICIIFINLFDQYLVVNLITFLVMLPVIGLSSLRRVRDAALKITLSLIPGVLFLLVMLTIVLVKHPLAYWLLCLSVSMVVMFALLTSQVRNGQSYILGYSGPIDLSELLATPTNNHISKRVEPSFAGTAHANPEPISESISTDYSKQNTSELKSQWLAWFTQNTKVLAISFTALVLCTVLLTWLSLDTPEQGALLEEEQVVSKAVDHTLPDAIYNKVSMSDDFDVATNQYNGLVISWEVTGAASGEVWSLASAKGKPGCDVIKFDKGQPYRTVSVEVRNNYYHAYFSPLDSTALVKAIAYRNNFSLCDFDFSLKGTQKQLMSVDTYADWLQ